MRLLRRCAGGFSLTQFGAEAIPPYAILSHTWGADTEEVTFEDLTNGTHKNKLGYEKIQFCGDQAARDGLEFFWIDTCCIDKANEAELSEAINSMFRWYCNASRCYVYLSDVSSAAFTPKRRKTLSTLSNLWESDFRKSRWFTRGWTLQELLAPHSVYFFSRDGEQLGSKESLKQQIHEITGIPVLALQGAPLSQFGVDERLLWVDRRKTKIAEDKVYSLLGIFDVQIPLFYGEGAGNALSRLRQVIDQRERCIQDLRITDPRDDKKRIEETKGGLVKDSYYWILQNSDYQLWLQDEQSQLLWIKGDPGKGKTMLLCGIINELNKSISKTDQLSYFFCQATDSRINSATAVLRGLLYMLFNRQPSLVSHIQKKHDHAGKALFNDVNSWVALSEIFTNVLQDPSLNTTYLIVDALDECVIHPSKIIDFIVEKSSESTRVKWIVSSRNWPDVEERLERAEHKVRLCLELNGKSVSTAVSIFIQNKVHQLADKKKYDDKTRGAVSDYLSLHANDTFLWVALVCQNLEKTPRRKTFAKLNTFPPGLDSLYERMMQQMCDLEDVEDTALCKQILALVAIVYRPITLKELMSLVGMLENMLDDLESLREIIGLCGSFLTVREDTVYFVHQSAKDFLFSRAINKIFPSGIKETHHQIFSKSLQVMSTTLQRDIYNLCMPGYPIEHVKPPDPDPLAASRYSCIYWIDHFCDWNPSSSANHKIDLQDFLRQKYLYWLEALSLCKSISKGVVSMAKLGAFMQVRTDLSALNELVQDARRFILSHKLAIEKSPLQAYTSALLFSPTCSLIRDLFKIEAPDWITINPGMQERWSLCFQTLEGHISTVTSVAVSPDSTRIVSGSWDMTVKIWDASSGDCLQTLKGHNDHVNFVAFSPNSTRLVSGSGDKTVKIWDTNSGDCLQILEGHSSSVNSVAFSPDSTRLVSGSWDMTVKIWDASSGDCLQTLEGHYNSVNSVAFSPDSTRLVSGSWDKTVKIWDLSSGNCLQTLEGHSDCVNSVAFSPDSTRLVSGSRDNTVKIWDVSSGDCLQTLEGHNKSVNSVAFSPDSTRLVSGSEDKTVKIWDASSGDCLQTLKSPSQSINSVAFSPDSTRLVSGSWDKMVKIWDASSGDCLQMLEGHSNSVNSVNSVAFSPDLTRLVSGSADKTVKLWDASSGDCLQTLEGHSNPVNSVAFSPNSTWLVSGSWDMTVKVWDACSGDCLQTLKGHRDCVNSVAFSPDSTRLVSGSWDKTVKIWDASSGDCLQTFKGHSSSVSSVAFSPDSTRLVSGSWDKTVKIWDLSSGNCLQTLKGHNDHVNSVAFSPDSTRLVSGSRDKTVKIWDASSGNCLRTLKGHSRSFNSVAFSPDSTWLMSDNMVKQGLGLSQDNIWITSNSKNLLWLPPEYRSSSATILKNTIVIGSRDGKVRIYKIKGNRFN